MAALLAGSCAYGQASGNINYLDQVRIQDNNIDVRITSRDVVVTVKGLANIQADSYVAIFNVTQVGENIDEVNKLIDNRIEMIKKKFEGNTDVEFYTDMISFVPVYEYESEKKLFSKKTYNEIPRGFELKMNIHARYKKPELLARIVSACSQSEVYDLVRVDYFSSQLEQIKKDLAARSKVILKEKLKTQQELLGMDFTPLKKQMADGYKVMYPLEMYRAYQAYSSTSLNLKKAAMASQTEKSTTLYYQPVLNKEFDFTMHPEILEPVIQVMYELMFVVQTPEDKQEKAVAEKTVKEYLLVTPAGEVKALNVR